MDWGDLLVKIGVGACLGFGIITLAKIVAKKNKQDQKTTKPALDKQEGTADRADVSRNK